MVNKNVKNRFVDEKTGIEYIKQGDYYLPNLVLDPEETNYTIGKYGRMKLNYLKNHKKAEYIVLFMVGKLNRYLHEIDIACEDRIKTIISQLVKQENVTEELKATSQMEWVCRMNSIKNRAEEINFLARHKFESIKEVEKYKLDLECKLPNLKGKREDLWRKYHKATNDNDKNIIKKEINELTENIDTVHAQRNACDRIINRYSVIREEYKRKIENKEKEDELTKIDRNKKIKSR